MKVVASLLLCASALVFSPAHAQTHRVLGKPANSIGKRLLPIGDSITWGANFTGGYRGILESRLRAAGNKFDFVGGRADNSTGMVSKNHEGHGGWSTLDILNGRATDPTAGKLSTWLTKYQPDVVLLMAGTNDSPYVTREVWMAKYESMLDTIYRYNPDTRVVLASIPRSYTPNTGKAAGEAFCYDIVKSVVAARKAKGFPIVFADTYTNFNMLTDLSDNYHPNQLGYSKIADAFYQAITKGFR